MKSIFVFRRDLRVEDNTALNQALKQSEVLPCFIFDPRQVKDNEYKSERAVQFMVDSLEDLGEQLKRAGGKLHYFHGKPEEVVRELDYDAVFVNMDYTPFSMKRDSAIKKACEEQGKKFFSFHDSLLNPPGTIKNGKGEPYQVFTYYHKKARELEVREPETVKGKFLKEDCEEPFSLEKGDIRGGREKALEILAGIQRLEDYEKTHDLPSKKTSMLSPHNKFGTVSIREAYHSVSRELGEKHPLLRQLHWRDFFTQLAWSWPKVFGHAFKKKYDSLPWENDEDKFDAWRKGLTGFPIVDAGMRELKTGFMHNRVRMIVGSFLVKDLHIDWRWGEKYFARMLVDYDPCVNNGNWQWVASTGADAQPYFRIFNPWSQQKRFDPDCEYIKTWVEELSGLSPKEIHGLEHERVEEYPKPMVDHKKESSKAKQSYKL